MGFNESEELTNVIQQLVKQEFNKSDNYISLFIPAKIGTVNGNYCDAYLNGSNELTTNIPVNPSISVGENDEVWVVRTNFKNTDIFVLCKRVLEGYEHDYDKILQEVRTQIDETKYQINAFKNVTNELTGKIDKNEAEFKITADEISSKVSKVQIEGLQTSNLLYNSEFNIGVQTVDNTVSPPVITYSNTLLEDWTLESPWLRSSSSIQLSTSGTLSFGSAEQSFDKPVSVIYNSLFNVIEGSKYVGSIYSLIPYEIEKNNPDGFWIELEWLTFEGNKIDSVITKSSIVPNVVNEWQRFYVVGTAPSGVSYLRYKVCSQTNGGIYIARPMLQNGEVLTAWNPSRQDSNQPLSERITIAESSITQTADQINSKVSQTTYNAGIGTVTNLVYEGNLYVRGTGYNRSANRILKLNNQTIYDTTGRGLRLTVIKRSDLSIVSDTTYDIYGDVNARTLLTNTLNTLTEIHIIVLSSWDAIITDTALEDAMKRCGGTGKNFNSSGATPNHRTPYVLIGIPSVGVGGGLEVFTSPDVNAPYAELTTKIINGTPQGMDSIKSDTYSRLTVAESNITQQAGLIALKVEQTTFDGTIATINAKLTDMSSDDKLAPSEKLEVKKEWDIIVMEKPILETQATNYSITTEKTNYVNAYNTLNTYITPLLADLTTTSTIVGSTFRSNFVNYYKEKQNLDNKIANVIKGIADTASTNATNASTTANSALGQVSLMSDDNKLTPNEKQQIKIQFDGIVQEKPLLETQATAYAIGTEKTNFVNSYTTLYNYVNPLLTDLTTTSDITGTTLRTNFANYYKDKIALQNKLSDVAKTTADSATTTANNVQTSVNDFSDDNKLTPNEKQQVKIHWDGIYQEKPIIEAQATAYGVTTEKTNYVNAYTTLSNYITPLLTTLTTTSTIVGATLRSYFQDYFTQKATLLKKLDDTTKGIADTAKTDIANFKLELASDNKLSPVEKIDTKNELNFITTEKPTLETMATNYGITVEKTDYTTAYNNLNTYLTPLLADMTTTSDIVGSTFLTNFQDYYTKRLILTNKIADVTKSIADSANLSVTNLKLELADDNKLTSVEKQAVKREWDAIVQERLLLEPQATKYQVSATNYVTAYTNLNNILTTPLTDLTTTSTIDGTAMRTNFVNYYKEKQNLINLLDDASVGAIAVQDSIKKNPIFDSWNGTFPDGYSLWSTVNPTKETVLFRTGKNAVRYNINNTTQAGMTSTDFQLDLANYKYIAVEIGFMLVSGSLSGAGLLFDWRGLTPYRTSIPLKDEITSPELNKWYTVKKIIKRPTDTYTVFNGYQIYLMSNYASDGLGALTTKDIIFDKILAREATKSEIEVFETLPTKANKSTLISEINLSPEAIKISSSKIDIQGAVTFTSLDSTMQTNMTNNNTTTTNFTNRNDRKTTIPASPTIDGTGLAVDHTINTDGSCDISFEWTFSGTGDAYNIDGFNVYIYQSASSTAYTFGTTPALETVLTTSADKGVFYLYGVPSNRYYTFGIQAYRFVDQDINSSGVLKSPIVKPSLASENPYLPSSNVAFTGNITGTVNGVSATTIATNSNTVSSWGYSADTTKIDGGKIYTGTISANVITSGTMSADRIYGGTINANYISVTNLNASNITGGYMSADRISGGTINGNYINVINLNAGNITSGSFSGDRIYGGTITGTSFQSYSYYGGNTILNGGELYYQDSYGSEIGSLRRYNSGTTLLKTHFINLYRMDAGYPGDVGTIIFSNGYLGDGFYGRTATSWVKF